MSTKPSPKSKPSRQRKQAGMRPQYAHKPMGSAAMPHSPEEEQRDEVNRARLQRPRKQGTKKAVARPSMRDALERIYRRTLSYIASDSATYCEQQDHDDAKAALGLSMEGEK